MQATRKPGRTKVGPFVVAFGLVRLVWQVATEHLGRKLGRRPRNTSWNPFLVVNSQVGLVGVVLRVPCVGGCSVPLFCGCCSRCPARRFLSGDESGLRPSLPCSCASSVTKKRGRPSETTDAGILIATKKRGRPSKTMDASYEKSGAD